jgi:hypothetical protein
LLPAQAVIAALTLALAPPIFGKEKYLTVNESEPILRGRVTDAEHKGLSNVQIRWTNSEDEEAKLSTETNGDGAFSITHKPCKFCRIEVYPPRKSNLSSAFVEGIPGEASRQVVLELHHGVPVKGRVSDDGRGLKNLTVAFLSIDAKSEKKLSAHGGGWAKTNRNGEFEMVLTPGLKRVEISNDHYSDLEQHYETKVSISQPGTISDIVLPKLSKEVRSQ